MCIRDSTKVVGFFVWGLMGLCAVVLVTAQRRWNRRMACVAAASVAKERSRPSRLMSSREPICRGVPSPGAYAVCCAT